MIKILILVKILLIKKKKSSLEEENLSLREVIKEKDEIASITNNDLKNSKKNNSLLYEKINEFENKFKNQNQVIECLKKENNLSRSIIISDIVLLVSKSSLVLVGYL